jgi:hypothetical protein
VEHRWSLGVRFTDAISMSGTVIPAFATFGERVFASTERALPELMSRDSDDSAALSSRLNQLKRSDPDGE